MDQDSFGVLSRATPQTPVDPRRSLQKRSRARYLSLVLAARLAALHSPLQTPYRRTYYRCSQTITQTDTGTLHTWYCGYRWCAVCGRIRTARAIETYLPVVSEWESPMFVTLTVPNVPGDAIGDTLDTMRATFHSAKRSITRTHKLPFRAIRKTEITYNVERGDYHPHYHVLVDNRETADTLVTLWLRAFPAASPAAQHVAPVTPGDVGSLTELFKYYTKLVTKGRDGRRRIVPAHALDTIFRAIKGDKVWQRFGFVLPKGDDEAIETETIEDLTGTPAWKRLGDEIAWEYDRELADWVDHATGEVLSEHDLSPDLRELADVPDNPGCLETIDTIDTTPVVSPDRAPGSPAPPPLLPVAITAPDRHPVKRSSVLFQRDTTPTPVPVPLSPCLPALADDRGEVQLLSRQMIHNPC